MKLKEVRRVSSDCLKGAWAYIEPAAPLKDVSDQATIDHEAFRHLERDRLDAVAPDLVDRLVDLQEGIVPVKQ